MKIIVPVRLATCADNMLVCRSEAKRILAGLDKFKTVTFDFAGVDNIGPSFADSVARVFANDNPGITIVFINTCPPVKRMLSRALARA